MKQKHSIDILIVELLQIIFWFNPVVLLYKRSLKIIHEYLADSSVLERFPDVAKYQENLFSTGNWRNVMSLANDFNSSIAIKKRLAMMTTEKPTIFPWFKLFLLTPLLFLLICSVNLRLVAGNDLKRNGTSNSTERPGIEIESTKLSNELLPEPDVSGPVKVVKKENIAEQIDYQLIIEDADERLITGSVKDALTNESLPGVAIIIKDFSIGTVTDISGNFVIKVDSSHKVLSFYLRGYNTVYMVITENDTMDVLMVKTDLSSAQPVKKTRKPFGYTDPDSPGNTIWGFDTSTVNMPMVILDSMHVDFSEIHNLNPDDIESISTIRKGNQHIIELYGKIAENGVIIIKTRTKEKNKK